MEDCGNWVGLWDKESSFEMNWIAGHEDIDEEYKHTHAIWEAISLSWQKTEVKTTGCHCDVAEQRLENMSSQVIFPQVTFQNHKLLF